MRGIQRSFEYSYLTQGIGTLTNSGDWHTNLVGMAHQRGGEGLDRGWEGGVGRSVEFFGGLLSGRVAEQVVLGVFAIRWLSRFPLW